jgi:hypothetical protein
MSIRPRKYYTDDQKAAYDGEYEMSRVEVIYKTGLGLDDWIY